MSGQERARSLHEPVRQLCERVSELQREFQSRPERRHEILVDVWNELQQRVADLATLDERCAEDRERFQAHLEDLVEREREARVAAEAVSALNDEFIATISHELRTPLTAILGWTHVLRSLYVDEVGRKAVEGIERSAKIQARLIEDLLDVSHMALGRLRIELKPVDIGSIVAGAISVVIPTAVARNVSIAVPSRSEVLIVLGDAVRLQQVFWNLLSNAVKFTPAGGRVDVDTTGTDTRVRVSVRDSGVGIDPAFLPYVFDRFRRGEGGPSRRYSGLGLGLSIVRQLVEAHGGTVTAQSAGVGAGAVFTVTLPLEIRRNERRREPRLPFGDAEHLDEPETW